jgi:hypothetical protein
MLSRLTGCSCTWTAPSRLQTADHVPSMTKSKCSISTQHTHTHALSPSFDVDLPADCDDDYWENENPLLMFKQPPGKPSKVSFFISLIKVQQILASALRTIVSASRM